MKEVINFIKNNVVDKIIIKDIRVYGWQLEYDHKIVSSAAKYLFEDLSFNENIVEVNDDNRPGIVKPNRYVTVHDTGDASHLHTAKFWSEAVYNRSWEQSPGDVVKYLCSYQYVVDNEGIYHNVPDNEVAYHAGDGTKFDYTLYKTNVIDDGKKAVVTISSDGYYEINNQVTNIKAPRIYQEKNGEVIVDRIPTTSDINDQSILCKVVDGYYHLGETYYSPGYKKIANRGGNNNSIGIESCITYGTDIYYTWQKTAKLVAYLLDENNLTIDDVKQHHYFSGKNCPQTIRMNGFWDHFLELVKVELQMRLFIKNGYSFKLMTNDSRISSNGRIKLTEGNKPLSFMIEVSKGEEKETIEFNVSL